MARPKTPTFGISVRIDLSHIHSAIVRNIGEASASGSWPGRPHPGDQLPASILRDLEAVYAIPPIKNDIINPMALLEHILVHGKHAIETERRAHDRQQRKEQIEAIAKANVGDPLPAGLHDEIYRLLTGAALRDIRCGANDWSRLREVDALVRNQTVVTAQVREWASWLIMFGTTNDRSHRKHGGGSVEAELIFLSELLNFGPPPIQWRAVCSSFWPARNVASNVTGLT